MVRSTNSEDRIRELCARALSTDDPDEVKEIATQLRAELRDQIARLKRHDRHVPECEHSELRP
jgi:hypothetical protein